jgi:hypothetical protein
LVASGCGLVDREPPPVEGFMARVDDLTELDELHEEIPFTSSEEWVESYRPGLSSPGYNLVLYQRRVPMLMDSVGRVVHSWPQVRAVGRARLDRSGRLLVIGIDDMVKEYSWEGELTWAYALPRAEDLPHHDVITLANGNTLVLAQETDSRSDYLHEVDRQGRLVWEWWPRDHLDEHFPDRDRRYKDPTHINSVFELEENRWFDGGDDRFRPGNILVSARNLDAVFIVDRRTGEIVWKHLDALDHQHEAQMIPRGVLGEGLVVIFNNGSKNRNAYRRTEIRVIDPTNGRLAWSYSHPRFFTTVAGVQQVLPNGNVLITSSEGGRAFEITPAKEKVWEWIPPFYPMRVARYPVDHCPQLEALGPPGEKSVSRPGRPPWVDIELGQYTFRPEYRVREVYGRIREVLKDPSGCRKLLLPAQPVIHAAYGFAEEGRGGAPPEATFLVTVRPLKGGEARTVIDETVLSTEEMPYRDVFVAVPGLGLQRVELCVDVAVPGQSADEKLHRSVILSNPRFYSQPRSQMNQRWKERRLSRKEQDFQERQLRAIGYVQ